MPDLKSYTLKMCKKYGHVIMASSDVIKSLEPKYNLYDDIDKLTLYNYCFFFRGGGSKLKRL